MECLKVSAYLQVGIAVYDDWSPTLDGLLTYQILSERNLLSANPTAEDVAQTQSIVDAAMPLQAGNIEGTQYWQCSAPCYAYTSESIEKFRKRWQPGHDSPAPDWGKRKAKIKTSEGAEKSYDLPLYLRHARKIDWYCTGDRAELYRLISTVPFLGKKRSYGSGQVKGWEVEPHTEDWHLWGPNGELMRPMPQSAIAALSKKSAEVHPFDFSVQAWGWRSPAWLSTNKARCMMPTKTAQRLATIP